MYELSPPLFFVVKVVTREEESSSESWVPPDATTSIPSSSYLMPDTFPSLFYDAVVGTLEKLLSSSFSIDAIFA